MCASTQTSAARWKQLFLGAEVFVVFACLYGLALRISWPYDVAAHPRIMSAFQALYPWQRPVMWAYVGALMFLLVASPFFLKSLRSAALRAWVIGAAAFACGLWLLFS